MVVIPERRGILLQRIVARATCAGHKPVLRIAVILRHDAPSMQVDVRPHLGKIASAAVQRVVDWQEVPGGQLVHPLDRQRLVRTHFDDRRERVAAVAPEARLGHVAMDLASSLAHGDAEGMGLSVLPRRGGVNAFRERQRIHERGSSSECSIGSGFATAPEGALPGAAFCASNEAEVASAVKAEACFRNLLRVEDNRAPYRGLTTQTTTPCRPRRICTACSQCRDRT